MPNPQANPRIKNTLMSMVVFLKHKAEEKNLKPVITVAKLTDMLRASGLRLSYQQLLDLTKDPSIAPSIKSINKNQIEFNLGDEESPVPAAPEAEAPISPEEFEAPEGEGGEMPAEGGDEDYNPDDFAMPEGGEEEAPAEAPAPEEGEPKKQESVVTQMAKRAAQRPD